VIKYFLKNQNLELKLGTEGAAGYDVHADIGAEREINPFERWKISTGLFVSFPRGVVMMICSRSGLAINHGIVVANAPGIVDSDYRGEVMVTLRNEDKSAPYVINPGDRIAQVLFTPVLPAFSTLRTYDSAFWTPVRVGSLEELGSTERGSSGHGSTGR